VIHLSEICAQPLELRLADCTCGIGHVVEHGSKPIAVRLSDEIEDASANGAIAEAIRTARARIDEARNNGAAARGDVATVGATQPLSNDAAMDIACR
jgi:hypothetical protein